jgi:tetratricopeptide (TPR) repeat protein
VSRARGTAAARAGLAFASVLALAGCTKGAPSQASSRAAESRSAAAVTAPSTPPSGALSRVVTTNAAIALGNLDAQIEGRERVARHDPNDVAAAHVVIDLLLARGEYASRVADYERASELAGSLVLAHPESGEAHVARAATLGTFHDFAAEELELDAAEHAKPPANVAAARATMWMAEGRFDAAASVGAFHDPATLDPMALATAGVLAGERGQIDESERLFERARASYRDVSPFPVAWMDFQRGALLERRGARARARLYFEEAHRVLPSFAHPAVHLAGMETPAGALAILEPMVGQGDDPQVDAAYADALRRLGRDVEANAATARARARYEELLRAHPLAFADHAAQFFLGLGRDPARAAELARRNAANRPTEPALDLWLTASLAAGAHDDACAAASAGSTLAHASAAFRATVTTTLASCGTGATTTTASAAR